LGKGLGSLCYSVSYGLTYLKFALIDITQALFTNPLIEQVDLYMRFAQLFYLFTIFISVF